MTRNQKVKQIMHLAFELQDDDAVPVDDIIEMLIFCLACIAYNYKVTPMSVIRVYDFWWKQVLTMQGLNNIDTPDA